MSDYSDKIRKMRWSYTRISTYEQCPLAFYYQYLFVDSNGYPILPERNNFYADCGGYMHERLEHFLKHEESADDALEKFLNDYDDIADGYVISENTRMKYFENGMNYLSNLTYPKDIEILEVEGKHDFKIKDYNVVGRIDLLYKQDGAVVICDHKSADTVLGKRGNVLKSKQEKYNGYERQMYMYAKPVIEQYGKVDYIEWNFFNSNSVYRVPFNEERYNETMQWVDDSIQKIIADTEFADKQEFFFCRNICDFGEDCEAFNAVDDEEDY